MISAAEIELVFEPEQDGGYHVYAPELPGLHTQGESLEAAIENGEEALSLYVEGLREDGESLDPHTSRHSLSTLPMPPTNPDTDQAPSRKVASGPWLLV